jgi:hypothetical protein
VAHGFHAAVGVPSTKSDFCHHGQYPAVQCREQRGKNRRDLVAGFGLQLCASSFSSTTCMIAVPARQQPSAQLCWPDPICRQMYSC